jgi:hypothetical protein
MTSRPPPQCLSCKHWVSPLDHGDTAHEPEPVQTCAAFPDAIPDDVWWNKVDHRQPVEGDGGIRWESLDGAEFPDWALEAQ